MPVAISFTGLIVGIAIAGAPAATLAQLGERTSITGRIVDRLGCPLTGVFKLRPGTAPFVDGALQVTRSDAEGRFVFADVAPGRYWIHFDLDANGGWGGDAVVVGTAGAHKEFNWPVPLLTDVQDLTFLVTDRDGMPIAGAKVSWRRYSGPVGGPACGNDITTDGDGRAHASRVPQGTYQVSVEGDGRVPQTRHIRFVSGSDKSAIFRLLTPLEADREARTVFTVCGPTDHQTPPGSVQAVVSRADAVVVGRIVTAVPDPDYTSDLYPTVLTRYDVLVADVVKSHPQLIATGKMMALTQRTGELEWGDKIIAGCDRYALRSGQTYVVFLTWNDQRRVFEPLGGGGFVADITTGEVAPIRPSYTPSPVITERRGRPATQFLSEIKAALMNSR